ncbi:MerC domain-containing protein [Pseudidiomarina sp.]|uniref:MerC domain-containing protein n=1 Tax=Pseudidiomarina sp. TaxID=2081707 RepID=UPI00299D915C|nr:MerC domain-containing protein [Pseudidiomarina sp.]MDX1706396.1 MerC domain-containing protein [Pseudidiomarina sp.]
MRFLGSKRSIDRTGIWVTTICAIHCLLLPVILPMLSLIGLSFIGETLLERTILGTSIIVGFIALVVGMRQHGRTFPVLFLIAGGVIYWHKNILGASGEPFVILVGAGLIIAAHWINLRLIKARQIAPSRGTATQTA